MNKTKLLKALSKIVKPVSLKEFTRKISDPEEINKTWIALLEQNYIAPIDPDQAAWVQLTAQGHRAIMQNTDIDKQLNIPQAITSINQIILYIIDTLPGTTRQEIVVQVNRPYHIISMHVTRLIKSKAIAQQGCRETETLRTTKSGHAKTLRNCQKTHPNTAGKAAVLNAIKRNPGMTLEQIMQKLFEPNLRTKSAVGQIRQVLYALSASQIITDSTIKGKRHFSSNSNSHTANQFKPKQIKIFSKYPTRVVKKAQRIPIKTQLRELLSLFAGITINREELIT